MATATASIQTKTEMRPVEVEVKTVTLVLSEEEAALLSAILFCGISGTGALPIIGCDNRNSIMNQLQHALGGTHRIEVCGPVRVIGTEPRFFEDEYFLR